MPASWACPAADYGDGICHCGCEAGDFDCDSPTQATCEADGCRDGFVVDPTDTRYCIAGENPPVDGGPAPAEWVCDSTWFGTGDGCDCGCGVLDSDCESDSISACSTNSCPNANDGFIPDVLDPTQCIPEDEADDGGTCRHTTTGSGAGPTGLMLSVLLGLALRRRRMRRA